MSLVTVGQKKPTRNHSFSQLNIMFRINFGIGLDLLVKYPLYSAWQSRSVALMVAAAAGGQTQPRVTGRLAKSRRRAQSFQVESSSSKFIANLNFRSHTVLRSTPFGTGA